MLFVSSVLVACVLAGVEGRLVRRQIPPGLPRPVIPPIVPRVPGQLPVGVNPLNDVPIISYVNENNFDGSYKYSFETGNGISVLEEGFLKNPGAGEGAEAQTSSGSYSYTAPDGQLIQVTWYADENGFHAQTGHGSGKQPSVTGFPPRANFRAAPLPGPIFNGPN